MRDQRTATRFLRLPAFVLALSSICFAPPTAIGAPASRGSERQTETVNRPQGVQDAAAAIKQLIAKYAEAVNAEPVDLGLASQVWLNSTEVSLIYPLGGERGWEQVRPLVITQSKGYVCCRVQRRGAPNGAAKAGRTSARHRSRMAAKRSFAAGKQVRHFCERTGSCASSGSLSSVLIWTCRLALRPLRHVILSVHSPRAVDAQNDSAQNDSAGGQATLAQLGHYRQLK